MQPQSDPVVENGLEVGSFDAEATPVPVLEPEPEPEPAPPVPAPGEILRNAREARGESVNDVARILKLSAQQLEALENGRFDILPGPTFVRGFLRNYARHLDIPPEPLLEGVGIRTPTAADLASMLKLHGNVQPKASPRPRGKALPVILAVLVVLALAGLVVGGIYKGWFNFKGLPELRFGSSAAAKAHEKATLPEPPKPSLPGPQKLSQPELQRTVQPAPQEPAQPAPQKPAQPVPQGTIKTEKLAAPVLVNLAPESARDPMHMDSESASGQVPADPDVTLRLLFNASTLAQVRDRSGKIIFTRTGTKGSISNIKGKPPFTVTVNNANNVKLEFNGQPVDLKGHTKKDGVARLTLE